MCLATLHAPSLMTGFSETHEVRLDHALRRIRATGARRVLDLGCGGGTLVARLVQEPQIEEIVGLERSGAALLEARTLLAGYLHAGRPRLRLVPGSLTEPQTALGGYEAAAMVETIEHIPPRELSRVERVVFGQMRPQWLFMTTPNRDYNPLLGLAPGQYREADHRFEWGRERFCDWADAVARRNGYRVSFGGIGDDDPDLGPLTQTAAFRLAV